LKQKEANIEKKGEGRGWVIDQSNMSGGCRHLNKIQDKTKG